MKFVSMLAAEATFSWNKFIDTYLSSGEWGWVQSLLSVLSTVLWVVLVLVGAVGSIYAVYVGIKMARADSAEARDENKKRLINIIVAIVVTIVLILFFNTFLPAILGAFQNKLPGGEGTSLAQVAKLFLH